MIDGEIILWAAVLGLLIGIIWALRYVIKLNRTIITGIGKKTTNITSKKAKKIKKK